MAKHDTAKWEKISDKSEFKQKQILGVAGLTHLYLLKDNKTYLKTVLSYNYTNSGNTDDTLDYDFKKFEIDNSKFIYKIFRATTMLNTKLDVRNIIRLGVIYTNTDFKLYSAQYSYLNFKTETQVNTIGNTNMLQAYTQLKLLGKSVFPLRVSL